MDSAIKIKVHYWHFLVCRLLQAALVHLQSTLVSGTCRVEESSASWSSSFFQLYFLVGIKTNLWHLSRRVEVSKNKGLLLVHWTRSTDGRYVCLSSEADYCKYTSTSGKRLTSDASQISAAFTQTFSDSIRHAASCPEGRQAAHYLSEWTLFCNYLRLIDTYGSSLCLRLSVSMLPNICRTVSVHCLHVHTLVGLFPIDIHCLWLWLVIRRHPRSVAAKRAHHKREAHSFSFSTVWQAN